METTGWGGGVGGYKLPKYPWLFSKNTNFP